MNKTRLYSATLHRHGVCCGRVSICASVGNWSSTKIAKHRIMQTIHTISHGLYSFPKPSLSEKFQWVHSQRTTL